MSEEPVGISIVIPLYRSGQMLPKLMERLFSVLDSTRLSWEVVLIDDGSPDDLWPTVRKIQESARGRVTAIQLMRNFGQHNALMCGFRHARGQYIVSMDDDLQHPPEEIPNLLRAIESTGDDVVYGIPDKRAHRAWRNLGSLVVTAFYRLVFGSGAQPSPFRIVRREVIDAVLAYELNYTFIDGLLAWNTQRISTVCTNHEPRMAGKSGYSFSKLLVLALNLFTNFSLLPLQMVSLVGILASLAGLGAGAYYLTLHALARVAVPGYASTIIAILVLGGLQLLALGIIGEYLGRLHLNVNRKPQYTVRHVLESPRPLDHPSAEGNGRSSRAMHGAEIPNDTVG